MIQQSDIEGLPPGAQVRPIQGLPPGAIVRLVKGAQQAQAAPPAPLIPGMPTQEQTEPTAEQHPGLARAVNSFLSVFGMSPDQAQAGVQSIREHPIGSSVQSIFPPAAAAVTTAHAVPSLERKGVAEDVASREALRHGDVKGFLAHQAGSMGYTGATVLAPVLGEAPATAGEQFGKGDIAGGIGTTTGILAPVGAAELLPRGPAAPLRLAHEVEPSHVEALTGLIDDRAGTIDPHETASTALPHLRETAVRMKIDPAQLKGREAGQATLRVAEQAVRDVQNEFKTISKPYTSVLTEQKPIADAYRSMITDELRRNSPREAARLEREAAKFDQPATIEQIDQFRVRMNNRLDAYERKGTSAQIMSDLQVKADAAAANAAREVEYATVGKLSGLDEAYLRELKQREGALIETKRSLEKEFNRASGAQGEKVSESLREKLARVYPSPRGLQHGGLREFVGPKPIEILNHRIQRMFSNMGQARPKPEYEIQMPEGGPSGPVPAGEPELESVIRRGPGERPAVEPDEATRQSVGDFLKLAKERVRSPAKPVEAGQVTQAHVAEENAFYTQARAELGADASPSAVLQRAQQLKQAAKAGAQPTLTQKVQAQPLPRVRRVEPGVRMPRQSAQMPQEASPQARAMAIMLQAKQGLISPQDADRLIQKLVGSAGRRTIRRPAAPQ